MDPTDVEECACVEDAENGILGLRHTTNAQLPWCSRTQFCRNSTSDEPIRSRFSSASRTLPIDVTVLKNSSSESSPLNLQLSKNQRGEDIAISCLGK